MHPVGLLENGSPTMTEKEYNKLSRFSAIHCCNCEFHEDRLSRSRIAFNPE